MKNYQKNCQKNERKQKKTKRIEKFKIIERVDIKKEIELIKRLEAEILDESKVLEKIERKLRKEETTITKKRKKSFGRNLMNKKHQKD